MAPKVEGQVADDLRGAATTARFMSKISPCPITGCWWWTAGVDKDGYGKFQTGRHGRQRHWRAHRFAMALAGIDVENDLVALHSCDNGQLGCVNPNHLRLGSASENRSDCTRKGRNATGDRNGARKHPASRRRGETHPMSRFTAEVVLEMRRLAAAGISQTEIGRRWGARQSVISLIVRRKTWRHVE